MDKRRLILSSAFFVNRQAMETQIIKTRLQNLKPDSPAQFGIMTAQHMAEHLILTVKISYGRIQIPEFEPNEKQLAQKQALIYTGIPFPKGVMAPGLNDQILPLRYPDLQSAKEELLKSIDSYHSLFQANPEVKTMHPRFGKLTYPEWEIFHPKHFEHHFGQFGI